MEKMPYCNDEMRRVGDMIMAVRLNSPVPAWYDGLMVRSTGGCHSMEPVEMVWHPARRSKRWTGSASRGRQFFESELEFPKSVSTRLILITRRIYPSAWMTSRSSS